MTRCIASVSGALIVVAILLAGAPVFAQPKAAPVEGLADTQARGDELVATLGALKAGVEKTRPMTDERIAAAKAKLVELAPLMGHDEKTIRAALDLVTAYDKAFGPLWVSGKKFNLGRGASKAEPPADIHWTVFHVMQAIMDHVYTPENVATRRQALEGFKFGCSDYFPGSVGEGGPVRGAPEMVKIDASYVNQFKHRILGDELPARRPTGYYLPPGGIVSVSLPESIVSKGYQIRVGAHSWDHSKKPNVLRLYRISLVYPITSAKMQIANPLGGGIYIEVPRGATAGVVEVGIAGAVPSPFFSTTPYRKTSNDDWKKMVAKPLAPWADFQSEKFQMQVPTAWVTKLDDPEKLMSDWDKAMTIYSTLMGLPKGWGREVAYMQVDLQLRGSAFFPGYPMGNDRYEPGKDYGGYANHYLVRGPQFSPDYPFHEMGHGFTFTKYPGDREAAVNFPDVAVLNRGFGLDLEEAFRRSRDVKNEFCTVDHTAIEWMMSLNFVEGKDMNPAERQYQPKGHAKYVDVVRLFGWDALDKFWGSITADEDRGIEMDREPKDTDALTLRFSKAAGGDLRPVMAFWGIATLDDAKSDAAMKAAGIQPSAKVYDLLVKYKGLIPPDNKSFRAFALKWWGRQPNADGYTTERNHAQRWEKYDLAEAKKVEQRMQGIINRFFPAGRPKE